MTRRGGAVKPRIGPSFCPESVDADTPRPAGTRPGRPSPLERGHRLPAPAGSRLQTGLVRAGEMARSAGMCQAS